MRVEMVNLVGAYGALHMRCVCMLRELCTRVCDCMNLTYVMLFIVRARASVCAFVRLIECVWPMCVYAK